MVYNNIILKSSNLQIIWARHFYLKFNSFKKNCTTKFFNETLVSQKIRTFLYFYWIFFSFCLNIYFTLYTINSLQWSAYFLFFFFFCSLDGSSTLYLTVTLYKKLYITISKVKVYFAMLFVYILFFFFALAKHTQAFYNVLLRK